MNPYSILNSCSFNEASFQDAAKILSVSPLAKPALRQIIAFDTKKYLLLLGLLARSDRH